MNASQGVKKSNSKDLKIVSTLLKCFHLHMHVQTQYNLLVTLTVTIKGLQESF